MRILIIVPSQDRISGNWVTAQRFQYGLEQYGHQVVLHETQLQADDVFRQTCLDFGPDISILLHAYRSGKPWLEAAERLNIPSIVVLTGTDVNHGLDDPEQREVIRSVLHQAACVLLQNPLIAAELTLRHPELTKSLRVLTPGILLGETPYNLRETHAIAKEQTLFLCPAGLRAVKGALQLLEMFDRVASESSACHLAFCGPILDESYGKDFLNALEKRPWASYLGAIPVPAMAYAMRDADVILNNSQAEGLANTLLEAATIGVPILARNIPGNAAVVRHEINGLRYNNRTEFTHYSLQLLNQERRQQLTCPDPERYKADHETAELVAILEEVIKAPC